jgi:hypothetical protein
VVVCAAGAGAHDMFSTCHMQIDIDECKENPACKCGNCSGPFFADAIQGHWRGSRLVGGDVMDSDRRGEYIYIPSD